MKIKWVIRSDLTATERAPANAKRLEYWKSIHTEPWEKLSWLWSKIKILKIVPISKFWKSCFQNSQIFPVLVPVLLPVTQICLTGSLYTILAVAIERFLAVTRYLLLPGTFVCNKLLPGNFVNRTFCHYFIFVTMYFFHQVLFSPGIFCTRHQILFWILAPYLIQKLSIRGIIFTSVNICNGRQGGINH